MCLQPLHQASTRQLRRILRRIGQHLRPQPLKIAVFVVDRGDLVIFLQQQLRMIDDGQRQNALAKRRRRQVAFDQTGLAEPIGNPPATAWRGCTLPALSIPAIGLSTATEVAVRHVIAAALKLRLEERIQPVAHILLVEAAHAFVTNHRHDLAEPVFQLGAFFRRIESGRARLTAPDHRRQRLRL